MKLVTVIVDRPLGSAHPQYPELIYPVNYGYIPGTLAPDGEPEDAYILGVDQPVTEFTGFVIAQVLRADDVEHKWIVAPIDRTFTQKEIYAAIHFQEQYFQSTIRLL